MPIQYEDVIMKSIMELFKGDAIKFFGIDKQIISAARTELLEIQTQKNINDWVWLAEDNTYIHFEFQSYYDKKDLVRFMRSDALLYTKEMKPIRTIVVYSAGIKDTITTIDAGSIQYRVEAFYMSNLDGDKTYEELKTKIESGIPLTKQDLMCIVFLPMMKNSVDKSTRIEHSALLASKISASDEQAQVVSMLWLLAEKFVKDLSELRRLKGLMNMSIIAEMIREDAAKERDIEIAKKLLKRGISIHAISEDTGLDESIVRELQAYED